ncbi:MAG TPA: efflux RND transporter permease subunit, partial [Paludibacteraceae bacterium]|nr:efflux RND transporter permease subunit [Paludibacteraceae bacterium]
MLDKIIKFSLNNKYLILCCYTLLTIVGIHTASQMDIDVFPDLTAPTVVVMTDCHGMAAEEVERLVTFPIETSVNGATGVRRVRSLSSQGFSFVWVEFDWNADIFQSRQIVNEKLVTVSAQMPQGVGIPVMAPQSSVMGEIFMVSIQSDSTSVMDLRTLADWTVKPLILATGGVSQVTNIGGDYKQYQVVANPQKMSCFHVSMDDLSAACTSISQNSIGNVVRQYGNEFVVIGIGRTADLEVMRNTLVKSVDGKPVRI